MVNNMAKLALLVLLYQSLGDAFRTTIRQPISIPFSVNTQTQTGSRHYNKFVHFSSSPVLDETKIEIMEPFGKGLKTDLSRKLPFYFSDFRDGFKLKTLSSTVFLFFACLAPAVAFGGNDNICIYYFVLITNL